MRKFPVAYAAGIISVSKPLIPLYDYCPPRSSEIVVIMLISPHYSGNQ